ncbi:hypothetical protein A1O3_04372 [Capronia epimyces CBS 606.96]|uniref:Uncharacterized protein n=1 Tax=Capronia epimyces CBS 606.96 TaxID=1182542 RepID=W9Y3P1_9EURO|nr:uncharacterized protein A1O3_04372 [Capronia epimyces CBS 606.96]EXJ87412.1 hypothetical protein A1O3_04372 [Capronia epimyces CBS 606.96]
MPNRAVRFTMTQDLLIIDGATGVKVWFWLPLPLLVAQSPPETQRRPSRGHQVTFGDGETVGRDPAVTDADTVQSTPYGAQSTSIPSLTVYTELAL